MTADESTNGPSAGRSFQRGTNLAWRTASGGRTQNIVALPNRRRRYRGFGAQRVVDPYEAARVTVLYCTAMVAVLDDFPLMLNITGTALPGITPAGIFALI